MSPHLSPSQVEMALNCLLAAYPEVVARFCDIPGPDVQNITEPASVASGNGSERTGPTRREP